MNTVNVVFLMTALTRAVTCIVWRNHILVTTPMSWEAAQAYCRENFTDLSTVDSLSEVYSVNSTQLTWFGLVRSQNTENFTQWSDGTNGTFRYWEIGQPDNHEKENCGCVLMTKWHDCYCYELHPFFCYTWAYNPVVIQETKTWNEARLHCTTHYVDLITINNELDLYVVNNKTTVASIGWTGLRFMDGSWLWVNKDALEISSLPSCPVWPFYCTAKTGLHNWEAKDCQEKMNFICYQIKS